VLRRSKHVCSVVLKRESDKSTNLASSCRTFPQINQRSSITVRTPLYTCTLHRFRMRTCALHTRQVRLPGAVYQYIRMLFLTPRIYRLLMWMVDDVFAPPTPCQRCMVQRSAIARCRWPLQSPGIPYHLPSDLLCHSLSIDRCSSVPLSVILSWRLIHFFD